MENKNPSRNNAVAALKTEDEDEFFQKMTNESFENLKLRKGY